LHSLATGVALEYLLLKEKLKLNSKSGYENIKIKKEPKLSRSFKALKDKGLKIKNYKEYNPK
jgi:hypothetical protein